MITYLWIGLAVGTFMVLMDRRVTVLMFLLTFALWPLVVGIAIGQGCAGRAKPTPL